MNLINGTERFDCFISYRRKTGFYLARVLCDRLTQEGFNCFFDYTGKKTGKFDERLRKGIDNSSYFVLLLTPSCFDEVNDDHDWFLEEVEYALRQHKTILPIRTEGFQWQNSHSDMTIDRIKLLEPIWLYQEYFEEAVERLFKEMRSSFTEKANALPPQHSRNRSVNFFKDSFKKNCRVKEVCMAFHAGSEWLHTNEKAELLNYFIEQGIPVRILINSAQVIDPILQFMRQPLKKYQSTENNVIEWKEIQRQYPEVFNVRLARYPLMHRVYLTCYEDNGGTASVRSYKYGAYSPADEVQILFVNNKTAYISYLKEFEYIWNHLSDPIISKDEE